MITRALILAAALSGVATSAEAQGLTINLGGGPGFPISTFSNVAGTGWHGLVGVGLTSLAQPIALRLDVTHYRFDVDAPDAAMGITSATLNLSYRIPMTDSPLSPYVTTGAGAYRVECLGESDCGSNTEFGWNAGLGTRIAALRLKWFLESRFQVINAEGSDLRFVPVTVGVTF